MFGIGKKDDAHKVLWNLHHCGMYARNLLRDPGLCLIQYKVMLSDSGVQRHSSYLQLREISSLLFKILAAVCWRLAQIAGLLGRNPNPQRHAHLESESPGNRLCP